MDSIDEALKSRAQKLEAEQAAALAEHNTRMAELKIVEDKARAERKEEQRIANEKAEIARREKQATADKARRDEMRAQSIAENKNNLRIQTLEETAAQTEVLAKRKSDLDHMEEMQKKAIADAEEALKPKVDTERITVHPLAKFLQHTPE